MAEKAAATKPLTRHQQANLTKLVKEDFQLCREKVEAAYRESHTQLEQFQRRAGEDPVFLKAREQCALEVKRAIKKLLSAAEKRNLTLNSRYWTEPETGLPNAIRQLAASAAASIVGDSAEDLRQKRSRALLALSEREKAANRQILMATLSTDAAQDLLKSLPKADDVLAEFMLDTTVKTLTA